VARPEVQSGRPWLQKAFRQFCLTSEVSAGEIMWGSYLSEGTQALSGTRDPGRCACSKGYMHGWEANQHFLKRYRKGTRSVRPSKPVRCCLTQDAKKAGCIVREETPVVSVTEHPDRVELFCKSGEIVNADFVVGQMV